MTIIKVKNISKVYKLYDSPISRLKEALHPFRRKYHRDFYALKDINFEVKKGETLGIVGKNGSGKSTLLKIITNVLTSTGGTVTMKGKISALLELGTGFNPEFTGIENIYFHSSIMGYSKQEIDERLDNIIGFADIGEFIYQPVKTYSSGMLVRLAFAVASNIDPDILVIDEILAVGDEAFQRKCFAKIQTMQENGATIIFVSHASATIIELCHRTILLDQGEIILSGSSKFVVTKYHQFLYAEPQQRQALHDEIKQEFEQGKFESMTHKEKMDEEQAMQRVDHHQHTLREFYDPNFMPQTTVAYSGNNDYGVRISNVKITTLTEIQVNNLVTGRNYIYTYKVTFHKSAFKVRFGMLIKTVTGFELGGAASSPPNVPIAVVEKNTTIHIQFRFRCMLHPGVYFMNAGVVGVIDDQEVFLDRVIDVVMFRVLPDDKMFETGIVSFDVEPSYSMRLDA